MDLVCKQDKQYDDILKGKKRDYFNKLFPLK